MEILISNTIIYCKKWQETFDFYKDVLGLEISYERPGWFVEFRVNPKSHLSLADAAHCSIEAAEGKGITLSFFVADLLATREHFLARGVEATDIRAQSWRAPWFYVWDPEGNRIEFWSNKAGAGGGERGKAATETG